MSSIRRLEAVSFDLVGTLACKPLNATYSQALAGLGLRFAEAEIVAALRASHSSRSRAGAQINSGTQARDSWADQMAFCACEALGVPANTLRAAVDQIRRIDRAPLTPRPEAATIISRVRSLGLAVVVCSNGPDDLIDRLERLQLQFDGGVSSQEVGARKPDRAIFLAAARVAGASPERVLHVGDSLLDDVVGALGAGMQAAWLTADADQDCPSGAHRIGTLGEMIALLQLHQEPKDEAWGPRGAIGS